MLSYRGICTALLPFVLLACSPEQELITVEPGADEAADKADGSGPKVELKITLADPAQARQELELGDDRAELRDVRFYDTGALELFDAGVVLRSRVSSDGDSDVTVKLRPLDPVAVDGRFFAMDGFKCEGDRTPASSVSSCSFTIDVGAQAVTDAGDAVSSLLGEGQSDFLATYHMPIDLTTVRALGPIHTRVWKLTTAKLRAKLTVESWTLPDGRELIEVSEKVPEDEADEAMTELSGWLDSHSLAADPSQETKTRAALEQLVGDQAAPE